MLKSGLRLQFISRAVRLDRYLRDGSGRKSVAKEDDVLQRIELKRGRIERTDLIDDLDSDLNLKEKSKLINEELIQEKFSHLEQADDRRLVESKIKLTKKELQMIRSNYLENILACKSPKILFNLIEPKLFEMNGGEIRLVYEKLNEFFNIHGNYTTKQTLKWTRHSIHRSPVFYDLQDRTNSLIKELYPGCLIAILETCNLMDFSPDQKMVKQTLMQLNNRLNNLEVYEMVKCLTTLTIYVEKPFQTGSSEMRKMVDKLLAIIKKKVTNKHANKENPEILVNCFLLFLNSPYDPDYLVIDRLTSLLIAPQTQITYEQALELLAGIEKSYRLCEDKGLDMIYLRGMPELIEKCNLKIFRCFLNDPSDYFLNFYMISVHAAPTSTQFSRLVPNFYDETEARLLSTLIPFLHRKFTKIHRMKYLSFNFVVNYAKFNIFDEHLLQLIYNEFQNDQYYRLNLNLRLFYGFLSKFRLPFVDHQSLVNKFMFCFINQSKRSIETMTKVSDYPGFLSDLILNDAYNENLFNHLINQLNESSEQIFEKIDFEDICKIRLARAYLITFSKLDTQLKSEIKSKLDQLVDNFSNISNIIEKATTEEEDKNVQIDSNVQHNGFLSNGAHVEHFGIFDEYGNSVCFDQYKELLNQIDRIPPKLGQNQKLCAFVKIPCLKGNIQNYENNYAYQLAKILSHFKIKPIQIFGNDFKRAFDSLKPIC